MLYSIRIKQYYYYYCKNHLKKKLPQAKKIDTNFIFLALV